MSHLRRKRRPRTIEHQFAVDTKPQSVVPVSASRSLFTPEGLDRVTTLLSQIPDPDVVLEKLGRPRADLRAMEGDDEISQTLDTRREAVIATAWRLESEQTEVRDWVWGQLDNCLEPIIRSAWAAVPFGYSALRVVFYPEQGGRSRIGGIADVVELPFEWFRPLRDGTWEMTSENGATRILEPFETEFMYFLTRRHPTYRNPYGEALLSRAYWPWFFRHNGWRFWMQFLERFGSPMLLGKSMDPTQMADALLSAVQDAVIAVGTDDEVQAISAQGNGEAFKAADDALVRRIQRLILGQTLTSDVGNKGSFAAAKVHNEVREDKRNADIRLVSVTVQKIINALTWLRFGVDTQPPEFVMEDGQGIEAERADRDSKLVQSGAVELTEQYLLRTYDFEEGDFKIPQRQPAQGNPFSASLQLAAKKKQRFSQDQQQIEDLADAALAQASSPIPVSKVREAVLASTGPEDLAERLGQLYEGHDPAEFRDVLERTLYLGDVMGYTQAEKPGNL